MSNSANAAHISQTKGCAMLKVYPTPMRLGTTMAGFSGE